MDYSSRIIKSPPTTIKEITSQENSAAPAVEQSKVQTGIGSMKDSFESVPVFTANPVTGAVNFGNGITGKVPPTSQNIDASYRYQGLLQQTKTEITDFLKGETPQGEPFAAMSSYLKQVEKDSRQEPKFQLTARELSLLSQHSKIQLDNKKIDEGLKEAGEKARNAMDAATAQLATGVVQGNITIGAAVTQLQGIATQANTDLAYLNDPAIESRYVRLTSLVTDLQKAVDSNERKSDELQKEVNRQEQATNKAQNDSSDSSSQTHRERVLDNIQKFLDILRQMNPQI